MQTETEQWDEIEAGKTYTHTSDSMKARETVLIDVPNTLVGTNRTYRPPSIGEDELSRAFRGLYLNTRNTISAQIPRQLGSLPGFTYDDSLTAIIREEDEINCIYIGDNSRVTAITWLVATDKWAIDDDFGADDLETAIQTSDSVLWQATSF